MEVVEVDVAIVGGGPAGEYAQVILNVVLRRTCSYGKIAI
jgi:ribulose 1,5-bisphosphate synthetase/thiazole synthase